MQYNKLKIAVLGYGSWATALVKLLSYHDVQINWYVRDNQMIDDIKKTNHNPNYLSSVKIENEKINLYSNPNECINNADIIIFVVPSIYFLKLFNQINPEKLKNKIIISAIKGIIPENQKIISQHLIDNKINPDNIAIIGGPCHAEEIALEKLSYLTIAANNDNLQKQLTNLITCRYVKISLSKDVSGIEYTSVLKNIMAVAAGICHGLGYGDNFQAVLLSNALHEIQIFLDNINPFNRDLSQSVYLGDLAVTAYSQFSRNRTFGNMIGKGYSVRTANLEMNMIAEGYYGTKAIYKIIKEKNINLPIVEAVYNILYQNISPYIEIKLLTDKLI
ncbi:MAG: NAD(P)H-dependent glycerol-3-phosphate dehydrogenase [Marinilabiliales bacterium]